MTFAFEVTVIILMLLLNAVFAAYEMALASISRSRVSVLVNEKKKGAQEAAFMKDRMGASLTVIQLGITMVGAFAAAIGGAGIEQSLAPYLESAFNLPPVAADLIAMVFFIIPLGLIIMVFAELSPKMFALNNKEFVILSLSPGMR